MRYLFVLLLAIIIAVGAYAQGTTSDKPDTRLDQKVTLEISHTKLEDVCKQLTELTGVTIKAGSGERDWKVRERRVTIEAKDIKLGTLMQEISDLLGFYLSKSGKEDEWAYLYWQDKKSRDLETEMLNAEKEAAAQRSRKLREAMIDKSEDALKLTPEEALKKRSEDPLLAYMGSSKSGRGFAQLFSSLVSTFPTEYELMLRGKIATMSLQGISSTLNQAILDIASGGIAAAEAKSRGTSIAELDPYQLVIMPVSDTMDIDVGLLGLGGMVGISGLAPGESAGSASDAFGNGNQMGMFFLMDPDAKLGGLLGNALLDLEAGGDMEEIGKRLDEELKNPGFLSQLLAKESPTEKDPPTDPKLTREIEIPKELMPKLNGNKFVSKPEDLGKVITELSKVIGYPIVLESFNNLLSPALFLQAGKQPLYKVLIACEKAGFSWDLTDDILSVRPQDWALRRSYEIPESFIAYYKDLIEKQGMLTLDDIAAITGALTNTQIAHSLMSDPDMKSMLMLSLSYDMGTTREMIRFYDSLTAQQKTMLKTETGLPFDQLSGEQWDRLSGLIAERLGGVYIVDGMITLIPPPEDPKAHASMELWEFRVKVHVADEKEPRTMADAVRLWTKEGIRQVRDSQRAAEEQQKKKAAEEQRKQETAK